MNYMLYSTILLFLAQLLHVVEMYKMIYSEAYGHIAIENTSENEELKRKKKIVAIRYYFNFAFEFAFLVLKSYLVALFIYKLLGFNLEKTYAILMIIEIFKSVEIFVTSKLGYLTDIYFDFNKIGK